MARGGNRRSRAIREASAAPRCTAGPSRPADPPDPSETAEMAADSKPSASVICPPRAARASMTSATAPVRPSNSQPRE